ncbi:NVEALA domain-containing protein, partial [Segatella copri]|nr:hypothetical protein [Segatella copri]
MKKILFFLSAVVMLIIVCVQTNSSSTDLLLENVEALSAGEVHFLTLTMRHPSWIFLFFGG